MSGRADGFTLVEAVIVITLLGILAWIALPKLTATTEIRLDAAARRVAADLRYAQSRAIGTRVVTGVRFTPGAGTYAVYAPAWSAAAVDPADRSKPLAVDFARRTEYQGVTIASASFGATPGVSFDYFGVPRDTAGTDLASAGRVVLSYQGLVDTVEVAPGTGKVTIR